MRRSPPKSTLETIAHPVLPEPNAVKSPAPAVVVACWCGLVERMDRKALDRFHDPNLAPLRSRGPRAAEVGDRKLQAAYAHTACADATRALHRLLRELAVVNESAARSLEEGLEETLTLHRVGVFPELGISFKATNLIESVMARVEDRTAKVIAGERAIRSCAGVQQR